MTIYYFWKKVTNTQQSNFKPEELTTATAIALATTTTTTTTTTAATAAITKTTGNDCLASLLTIHYACETKSVLF